MSYQSAMLLAQALEKNTTLTSVNLSKNDIGNDGTMAIASVLEKNTTLTSINLSCNDIDAEAVMAIAFAIEKNTILTFINLDNDRHDEVTRAPTQSLKTNGNLKVLNFSNASIDSESITAITCIIEKVIH